MRGRIGRWAMDEQTEVAAPDALWLAALARDRDRAAVRLADLLPGRDVGEAAALAARCVHAELDREARIAARPRRGAMVEAGIARWLARRKRREPATRRRWATMVQGRPCEPVPPPWGGELRGGGEYRYDAGAEWGAVDVGAAHG